MRAGLTIRCFKRLTHSKKHRASKWKATENKSRKKHTKDFMVRSRHHSHNFPFLLNFFLISLYFSKTSFTNSLSPHNILPSSIISRMNVDPSFSFFKKIGCSSLQALPWGISWYKSLRNLPWDRVEKRRKRPKRQRRSRWYNRLWHKTQTTLLALD